MPNLSVRVLNNQGTEIYQAILKEEEFIYDPGTRTVRGKNDHGKTLMIMVPSAGQLLVIEEQ